MMHFYPFSQFAIKWPTITYDDAAVPTLLMFFIVLSILEAYFPKIRSSRTARNQSVRTNLGLLLFNNVFLSAVSFSSLVLLADHFAGKGLLSYVANPALKVILAFLALDLLLYLWHKACHEIDTLWMFHRVHHSDELMSVSTAFRVHILELMITNLLKVLYIIVLGVDKFIVMTTELVMTLFVLLHHTNISFIGENLLKWLIIVPRLHRVHHSVLRKEHDRNYGAVLSIWDRLFGTWADLEPGKLGITNNPGPAFKDQLLFGFIPVRPSSPHTNPAAAESGAFWTIEAMVAEAAYYKAEKRGFIPGYDMSDWLEAEKEIQNQMARPKTRHSRPNHEPFFCFRARNNCHASA